MNKYLTALVNFIRVPLITSPIDDVFLEFPKPTGPYAIGKQSFHLIDESRREYYDSNPSAKREMMVRVWYPAIKQPGVDYKTLDSKCCYYYQFKEDIRRIIRVSDEQCKEAFNRVIYSSSNAEIAKDVGQFPVLFFSPGFHVATDSYSTFIEQIVSHGYVVVGVDSSYICAQLLMSDGRILRGGFNCYVKSYDPLNKNYQQLEDFFKKAIITNIEDMRFVFNTIIDREKSPLQMNMFDFMDFENIGMIGHACGGTSTIEVCRTDARVKAAFNLDGALFSAVSTDGFEKPLFTLYSENFLFDKKQSTEKEAACFGLSKDSMNGWCASLKKDCFTFYKNMRQFGTAIMVKNAAVGTFTNNVLWNYDIVEKFTGNNRAIQLGTIDPYKAIQITNDFIQQFFDKYLKGKPSTELDSGKLHAEDVIVVNKRHWNEI